MSALDALPGLVVSGGLAFAGIVYVQRVTQKLSKQSDSREDSDKAHKADVERDQIEAQAYARARESYEAGIKDMTTQGERRDRQHAEELLYLTDRLEERNRRIRELEQQLADMREVLGRMNTRLSAAEQAISASMVRADHSETRADAAEAQADTDRENGNGNGHEPPTTEETT